MKKFTLKKKMIAGAAVAALALGAGSAAFAYWTTTGAGSGSGTVASSNGTLVLHGLVDDGLTPGGSETVHFTADNLNTSSLQVGTIHLSNLTTSDPLCLAADFGMPDVSSGQVIAASTSDVVISATGTMSMADTAVNQDHCQGATLTLTLSS